jgi:outer membrane lipopolysaccharide assembly protein LptE/RlpB
MMKKLIMFSIAIISVLNLYGCGFNVRPTKTSISYGQVNTTNDTAKDAKNDSTTTSDSFKESWNLKQDFIWEK